MMRVYMPNLHEALNTDVTVKLAGFEEAFKVRLVALEEWGIWIASQELSDRIRNSRLQSALSGVGSPKVFVPFARLDWLVRVTEN
jgi:hypothetical protein